MPGPGGTLVDIAFLDNENRTVADALNEACRGATRARVAVAFAKGSGLVSSPALDQLASRGRVELLAGVDFQLTDLSVVERFERPPSEARVFLHPDTAGRVSFHPKVYLAESDEVSVALVGSSNLTAGGLGSNVEANVLVRGTPETPLIQTIRAFHARLWNSGFAFRLTDTFRKNYSRLQERRHMVELNLRAEADFARAQRDLRTAVVEAIASYRTAGQPRCWLLITSRDNYIRNIEGRIWGDEKKARIAQVRPGDLIYFYITKLMQLGAMGIVTRELYEDRSVHWHDGRIYPYRFGFSLMIRPPSPVPFRPLVPSLDLFGRQDSPNWGQSLQTSMLSFTAHDCEVLRGAISQADAGGAVA
jgi:HKD family nuclease